MKILRNLLNMILLVGLYGVVCQPPRLKLGRRCVGKYEFSYFEEKIIMEDRLYSPLQCNNCAELPQTISLDNTGVTIVMNYTFSEKKLIPTLTHGPLEGKGTYRFSFAYFNWLTGYPVEYDFNKIVFNAEVHLVFYNIKHGDYERAVGQAEGIAILSTGFKVRSLHYVREIDLIANGLNDIREPFTSTAIKKFPLFTLLPEILSEYYTYIGTMTSEKMFATSCKPDVIWIDFEQTLKISPNQVAAFNKVLTNISVPIVLIVHKYKAPKSIVYRGQESLDLSMAADNQKSLSSVFVCGIVVLIFVLVN